MKTAAKKNPLAYVDHLHEVGSPIRNCIAEYDAIQARIDMLRKDARTLVKNVGAECARHWTQAEIADAKAQVAS